MAKQIFLFLLCAAIISLPTLALCQEENVEYSSGTVIEIRKEANELVISEYDWDTDGDIETVYIIDADTEIENMDAWQNIPNGSYVDIEYVMDKNGKKTVNFISVYEPEPEGAEVEAE